MSDRKQNPRKTRRRRATGRVSGTTQSGFASRSMSDALQRQRQPEKLPEADKEAAAGDEADPADDRGD